MKSEARAAYQFGAVNRGERMKAYLFAALAFLVIAPAAQAQRGEWSYVTGDYAAAARRFGPAAERGNARAQAYLGFMYQYGRGVPQNHALAVYWYRRGAEQGKPSRSICSA